MVHFFKEKICKVFTNVYRFGILSFNRILISTVLLALLLPITIIGQTKTVSANILPINPLVEMPGVLLSPPQPFQRAVNGEQLASRDNPLLVNLSIWDSLPSLVSSISTNSTNFESSENSINSENPPLLPAPSTADLSRARLSPKNQTGGTSLYSRNFGWGTGLAGLSGRGLDAGFGISYNSLIWTKVGTDIVFNPNNDNVTPGFRFGFPVIESSYTDPLTSKTTHLMVTPSGGRVEFRLLSGSSDTFESADSSYTQLKIVDSTTLAVNTTDGTQAVYTLKNGAFRVASIRDSNGNYVTVNHDTNGLLQSVTDTLGRVINIAYDSGGQPTSITQTWAAGTHTFATFTYTTSTVNTNFSGLTLIGLTNNTSVKVLQKITFADSSYVTFDYNTYGQVWKVSSYAADNHLLNYSAVNLDNSSVSSAQTDVPRYSEFRNWTENFNLDSGGTAQEVVISVSYQENQNFTLPNSSTVTGTLLQVTAPDGVVSKTYVGNSGWMEAVPVMSEDWVNESGWVRKRWNYTGYTQDDTNLGYILNPRVIETQVGDVSNVKRITIDYHIQSGTIAQYGLVKDVIQYDTNGSSQLKKSHTEYNLDSNYTSRRIIGLPSESTLYDYNNALMAKVTYQYDEGNFSGTGQSVSAVNHDSTNFGTGFMYRGNLTSTTRWDVTAPTNSSYAITSSVKYNITGNPISKTDPLNRTISISYTDNYDDSTNHNSFAYPTTITDPASNSSTVKYRFETGANVYAESPAPAGQSVGKKTSRTYDSIGRLQQETVINTGAYTRYEYPTNGIQGKVYSTIVDVNSNGADSNDEVLTESFVDGAGRIRMSKTEHPGSTGGWSASITEYDVMGRVRRSSVPTEVNSGWTPAGDDSVKGWTWNSLEYDWKGRVTRQINTDGTDKLMSYDGCGCAGGQVTTIQSELVPRDDNPSTTARRTQKVYEDILGRTYKSETLNWSGTVYSTHKSFFNGRDQVTTVRQYAGNDSSSTYQDTVTTYDGHGRLYTQHRPEQSTSTNTTYSYFADDRIQQVVDARGATVNYTYDVRGLTTQVSTTSPDTVNIPVTPTVTYTYDNVGNRTQMTDGLGTQTYQYDQLSQLISETRQFTDTLSNAPLSNNSFQIQYSYSLSGQLSSITDPYGQQINYSFDKTGRLNSVTGSSFGGVTNYASNTQYRAWGGMKHIEYFGAYSQDATFNNRLQADSFKIFNTSNPSVKIFDKVYQYYADSALQFIGELTDTVNKTWDRSYTYDHAGRIFTAKSGIEASGGTVSNVTTYNYMPYRQSYAFDAFNNIITRTSTNWKNLNSWNTSTTFTNNRAANITYDADGNGVLSGSINFRFDAGRNMVWTSRATGLSANRYRIDSKFDGDGREIKRSKSTWNTSTNAWGTWNTSYFIYSSLLKELLSDVAPDGKKSRTYIFGGGRKIAYQELKTNGTQSVRGRFIDASGNSIMPEAELDPMGNNLGIDTPAETDPRGVYRSDSASGYQVAETQSQCTMGGISGPCEVVENLSYGRHFGDRAWDYGLPMEMTGRTPRNDNNSMAKAGKIMSELAVEKPDSRRSYEISPRERSLTSTNYDSQYLNYLLGNATEGQVGQKKEFKSGDAGIPISQWQKERLQQAYDHIVKSSTCLSWLNELITERNKFHEEGRTNVIPRASSAENLLSKVELNIYSPDLSRDKMGLDPKEYDKAKAKYGTWNSFTAFAEVGGSYNIWLNPSVAFKIGSFYTSAPDLPATLIHEMLHVYGIPDPNVKNMNAEIQKNCGWGGYLD